MNFNVSIVDQQVRGLADRLRTQLEDEMGKKLDDTAARSAAFVVLCVKTLLDLTDIEAIECLTEGGNDFGVDAIEVGDTIEGEFLITLFQCKYRHADLEGNSNFPENGVDKAVKAVRALFNPQAPVNLNPRLQARIEEVRSLITDGIIPRVRYLLCNNGLPWKRPEAQNVIDRENFPPQSVHFEHVNHDVLISILQATQAVKDTIQFSGKAVVEDFNFSRVFVGKVAVGELARLMDSHGDRLLERNIRRYLGLQGNRVNEAIRDTLTSPSERPNFFFYNNGITLICSRFDYNALQNEDYKVRVEGLQIINGGQTCKTIQSTLANLATSTKGLESAYALVRLYQVGGEDANNLVRTITYATNSQNPVDLRDLRSNDPIQKRLELSMRDLGYEYRRQRNVGSAKPTEITTGTAAEAILSVWRQRPQQAKFRSGEHFGKLYEEIFSADLNGAQTVAAVLIFRIAENKRKRPPADAPEFVRYASCFAAMLMGEYLLADLNVALAQLDHRNFDRAREYIDTRGDEYFRRAIDEIGNALKKLYGDSEVSLQRLSATFRRGDLLQELRPISLERLLS
ncbi:AIPR family protein [Tahibacter amnicola]|uniref:AIPR family protein n=1 Tax=Tahibacter amnicola TaxID=2976241 RepID=A0ABY6BEN4_9GAMM|nr:AIPR family protein [Tahibacter amnicola]UXI68493.1 AIPR family protein [Tahibacter amnicola]